MTSNHPQVSFIIPHKGREALLRATLDSIAAQHSAPPWEVILITQNPTLQDSTQALLTTLQARVQHADPALTISALRNAGVQQAQGRLLAFLDADIGLAEDWLATLVPLLDNDSSLALASAAQANSADAPALERLRTALSNADLDGDVRFLPGRNLLLRRDTFNAVGGFPEHLVTCEDYYFTDRVANHGRLLYTGRSHYVHLGEDRAYDELFRKEQWRGQSNLLSIPGRPIRAAEWPSFIAPLWISGAPVAALIAAAMGKPVAAITLLTLALLPFLSYVTRLYLLAARSVPLADILRFYATYFPARAIGTLRGLWLAAGVSRKPT